MQMPRSRADPNVSLAGYELDMGINGSYVMRTLPREGGEHQAEKRVRMRRQSTVIRTADRSYGCRFIA